MNNDTISRKTYIIPTDLGQSPLEPQIPPIYYFQEIPLLQDGFPVATAFRDSFIEKHISPNKCYCYLYRSIRHTQSISTPEGDAADKSTAKLINQSDSFRKLEDISGQLHTKKT